MISREDLDGDGSSIRWSYTSEETVGMAYVLGPSNASSAHPQPAADTVPAFMHGQVCHQVLGTHSRARSYHELESAFPVHLELMSSRQWWCQANEDESLARRERPRFNQG